MPISERQYPVIRNDRQASTAEIRKDEVLIDGPHAKDLRDNNVWCFCNGAINVTVIKLNKNFAIIR